MLNFNTDYITFYEDDIKLQSDDIKLYKDSDLRAAGSDWFYMSVTAACRKRTDEEVEDFILMQQINKTLHRLQTAAD